MSFDGQYICSVCKFDFQCYQKLKEHFEDGKSKKFDGHLKNQKNFLKVSVYKHCSAPVAYYLPINIAAQKKEKIVMKVPIYSHKERKVKEYATMNYAEFL
jgi:hypothetical protein